MISRLTAYVRGIFGRRRIEEESDEELRFHLDHEIAANVARGMSPRGARRAALRDLGGLTQTTEAVRDVRSLGVDALWLDVRYAVRTLIAARRFTLVALGTIVLVVGGIATVFTLVNSVLLRPLPYPNASQLVRVELKDRSGYPMHLDEAIDLLSRVRTLERSGVYTLGYGSTLDPDTEKPIDVVDLIVTPSVFPILGIQMAAGRPLVAGDAQPDSPRVAVISHDLWQSRFGGRADVIGQSLPPVNRRATGSPTIVGVMAADTAFPLSWLQAPMVVTAAREPYARRSTTVVGKLPAGAGLDELNAELDVVSRQLAVADPETYRARTASATTLLDAVVGDTKHVLWIFFGAVSCVLLIGIANLISVQTVRNSARSHEMVLRAALGASRWRLVRQLLVEAALLSIAGGLVGLGMAMAGVQLIVASLPASFPRAGVIAVDPAVVVFCFGVSVLVALVVGIVPGWRASRSVVTGAINEESRTTMLSARRGQVQRLMIAVETALALVLLVGGGLLINSFGRLISQDAGMNEDQLWAATVSLPTRYRGNAPEQFWTSALAESRNLPQVASAAITVNMSPPLSGGDMGSEVFPEGSTAKAFEDAFFSHRRVSDNYFETLGIPLLSGTSFDASTMRTAPRVVVLNQAAARLFWPNDNPIGKRVQHMGNLLTVTGIIPTLKIASLAAEPTAQFYVPYTQDYSFNTSTLMLRENPGEQGLPDAIRTLITNLEPEATVEVSTMAGVRWKQLADERFRTAVLMTFAGTALFLALVGIFGVVSYSAVQRTREIGLRVALGATRKDVVTLLLRQTLAPAIAGLVAGAVAAVAGSGLLSTFLFAVSPTDPFTFAAAVVLLTLAALGAGLLPALRVSRINPMVALRHE